MSTVWRFHNNTTGKDIECDDLAYLLFRLQDAYDLIVPRTLIADLLLRGKAACVLMDTSGVAHEVVIGEHSPERGIIFDYKSIS